VTAVNVPSGGTNTTWTEGGSQSYMMSRAAVQTSTLAAPVLTVEEREARLAWGRQRAAEGRAFLEMQMQELNRRAAQLHAAKAQGLSAVSQQTLSLNLGPHQ
jgi:hypothetical protein